MTSPTFAYTNRDAKSIRENLVDLIPYLTDKWTDFNESDPGMVILEHISLVGDMLSFYLDRQAHEVYLPTVRERKNAAAILRLIGYTMHTYVSASTTLRVTVTHNKNVYIPAYTQFATPEQDGVQIVYSSVGDVVISPGSPSVVEFPVVQGLRKSLQTTVLSVDSSGRIRLPDKAVGQGLIKLWIDGIAWSLVDDVYTWPVDGRYFSQYLDKEDNVYVALIPGWSSWVSDPRSSTVLVKYLVSMGRSGKVGSGVITETVEQVYDSAGVDVSEKLMVTNPLASTGGEDPETIEEARRQAPREHKTMDATVTLEDFVVRAEGVPGVARATALDWSLWDSPPEPPPSYYIADPWLVHVYIVPVGGGTPSDLLKSSVLSAISARKVTYQKPSVHDPVYVPIDVTAVLHVMVGYQEFLTLQSMAEEAVRNYFLETNPDLSFGCVIRISSLIALLEGVSDDVRWAEVLSPSSSVALAPVEFPVLGALNISVVAG